MCDSEKSTSKIISGGLGTWNNYSKRQLYGFLFAVVVSQPPLNKAYFWTDLLRESWNKEKKTNIKAHGINI